MELDDAGERQYNGIPSFTMREGGHWADFPCGTTDSDIMEQLLDPKHRVDLGGRWTNKPDFTGHTLRIVIHLDGHYFFCAAIRLSNSDVFDAYLNAYRRERVSE